MISKELEVANMSCQHCVMAIKKELQKLNLAQFEVEIGKVKVMYDESSLDDKRIIAAIEEAGYKIKE